jgi:hypothetical protein
MLFYLGLWAWVNGGRPAELAADCADGAQIRKKAGSTMIAMRRRKKAVFTAIVVALVCVLMTGCRYRSTACKQRGAAYQVRVESLEQAALEQLKIGTKKEDVVRFFAENKFPLSFGKSGATGTIYTTGCSPFGCGTDEAVIDLSIELDEAGNVKSKPVVVGFYTNCL